MGVSELSDYQKLVEIVKVHGIRSNQFCSQVKNFIIFVLRRYSGEINDDLIQEAYARIFEAFEYYDDKKCGNVVSYLYSIVRNISTVHNYYGKKQNSFVSDEAIFDLACPRLNQGEFENRYQVEGLLRDMNMFTENGIHNMSSSYHEFGDLSKYKYVWRYLQWNRFS